MQPLDLSFSDTEIAFKHKSDYELKKSKFIFSLFKSKALVKYGPGLSVFGLKIGLPIKKLIKDTVFYQFCGGETIDECDKAVSVLWASHVGSILDYSVEGHEDEATFDANVLEIKHTIDKAKGNPKNPFCVFKPTGIARFALLEKLDAGEKLDHDELAEYYRVVNRFDTICKAAFDNKVRLFVDAEETWIQKTLDSILNDMMEKYNKESVIVYNTVQLYRKGRVEFIQKCIDDAREKKYKLGFKLVRGAYLEKETERALKMNYPNPIQDTKIACDTDYDAAVKLCFDNRDIVAICAGTHNEQSSMKLAELMAEAGVDKSDPHFWFAQLYGMSDNISFNLAAKGYNVAKYLPYGPLRYVMPYLGRRAKENSSMSGQMGRELSLIMTELKRRKLA